MPVQPLLTLAKNKSPFSPIRGTPGGYINVVVASVSQTVGALISLIPTVLTQYSNQYYDQLVLGFIADATPTAGPLFAKVNGLPQMPVYQDGAPATDTAFEAGNYCQLCFDASLGTNGGFHLLNWDRAPASAGGETQVVTDNNPVTVPAEVGLLIFNKAAPGASSVTLGPVAARNGLPLKISDFSVNSGPITITPAAGETIMSQAQWVIGSGGSNLFNPSPEVSGWVA